MTQCGVSILVLWNFLKGKATAKGYTFSVTSGIEGNTWDGNGLPHLGKKRKQRTMTSSTRTDRLSAWMARNAKSCMTPRTNYIAVGMGRAKIPVFLS